MKHTLFFLFLFISTSIFSQNKNQSIGFKENKGQIIDQKGKPNPDVKYLLNTNGLNVQIKTNGFSYDIYETKKHPLTEKQKAKLKPAIFSEKEKNNTPDYSLEYIYHRIDIDFVNSNPKVELIAEEKSTDYDNYYNVPNKPDGVLMVHQYQQITYKNIYPNIDVVFSIPKDSLKPVEYNFVVHPKGKISDIQLKFNGVKTELVDNKIKIQVRFGEMEETLPMSWTEDGKCKKEITVGYTKIKNNIYGFESSENTSNKTMVIDPVPTRLWGTFYGDGNSCTFKDIDSDKNGNTYFVGYTSMENSFGFYATTGAHQTTAIKDYDGIIAKFDSDGKRIWGTYYGGESFDRISGIKFDKQNNFVITGSTSSTTNISTPGSYKSNSNGGDYVFLAKFNSSGARIWGTYFGGGGLYGDNANDIDIDNNDNIYVVGNTTSRTGISINNNFQTSLNLVQYNNSSNDGFLAKFNSSGFVIWSTYIGGENEDYINTIKVSSDFLVLGGMTYSKNYISTPNTFQTNNFNNWVDGTAYKFSLNGDRIWSTYYGGEGFDKVLAIGLDNENNIYLGGSCQSKNNIATPGSFDESNNSPIEKGFIAKLNKDGQRIWGTYFGEYTILYSIIFKNDFLYLGGMGNDAVWLGSKSITTPCTYEKDGNSSGYIGKISTDGNLIIGTFVGGGNQYSENKICFDNNDNIIIGGTTSSPYIETNPDSYQPNMLGNKNFYLMKFSEDNSLGINTSPSSNSPVCIGNKLIFNVDSGYNYLWTGPNGFSSNLQNPFIDNTTNSNSGVYNLIVSNDCGIQKSYDINVVIGDIEPPIPNLVTLPTITGDCHTQVTTIPTATDTCAGAITATTTSPLSYNLPGTYTIVWNYDDGNGNSITQNQTFISSQPLPTTTSPQIFCIQQNADLNLIAITGQNIKWYDTLTNGNLLVNTTPLQDGITYYASQTINGCESDRVPVIINIQNTLAPTANATQSFCTNQSPTLNTISVIGTNLKWYDNLTTGNLLSDTTPLQDGKTYYASQTVNNCESQTRVAITVSLISSLPAQNYAELLCDDLNNGTETVNLSSYNSNVISNDTNYNFSYYNSPSGAQNETSSGKISNITNYKLALGENKIYVRVNSNTICYGVAELKLTLLSKPKITIEDIVPICENKTITIDAGAGFDAYLWSNGAVTRTITVSNPGNFSVTVTKNHSTVSCSSTKNFTVKESNKATINSIETKDWTDTENTITIFVSGNGNYEYSIDGFNYQDSNAFTGLSNGEYTVQIRDKNGCGIIETEEIYLLMFPKFFTPNNDHHNDTWKIKLSDFEKGITVKIYDRYGKLMKTLANNNDEWDGKYNGIDLPSSDYWFVVKRANGKEHKGHFSLKR